MGKPVLDELRMCYIAPASTLEYLSSTCIGEQVYIEGFILYRTHSDRFEYQFIVGFIEDEVFIEIGIVKFGRYGDIEAKGYIFYKVENNALYNDNLFRKALEVPNSLKLVFNNFSAIDIAIDFSINVSALIKRMIRDKDVRTLVNGKLVDDRNKTIRNITFTYSTTLNKLKVPTITIKQAAALKNKMEGITIQSYDKAAEITDSSGKEYILEYYGYPKRLHRLEVRANRKSIQRYCMLEQITPSIELITDENFLWNLYEHHLSSVLRFKKGRRDIKWGDLLRLIPSP